MPLIWNERRAERISSALPWSTVKALHRGPPLEEAVKIPKPTKGKNHTDSAPAPVAQSSSESDSNQNPLVPSPAKRRKIDVKKNKKKSSQLNDTPILGPPPTLKLREKWSK